jgi:molybdopterin/thiamine biosynthesis adenylyltransferase
MDFDGVEQHNLDRLVYATREDVGKPKVDVLERHLSTVATAAPFRVEKVDKAVYETDGFAAALDCDVLIACVDRPWGRYILNLIANAHLIPVVDGGISVRTNRFGHLAAADWRAHTAVPGRACLQCLGQYDPAYVQMEREGLLDDPTYIENLPKGHPLKARENVFAFALACGSMQILQLIAYVVAPLGLSNPGAQHYHFVGNMTEPASLDPCHAACVFRELIALGDHSGIIATGVRPGGSIRPQQTVEPLPRKRRWWTSLWMRLLGAASI